MKLEIYGQAETEKVVRLKLVQAGDAIHLEAVDDIGVRIAAGTLLSVNEKGVSLHTFVSPDIGLPLDNKGRVKLRDCEPGLTIAQRDALSTAYTVLGTSGRLQTQAKLAAAFPEVFR